MRDNGRARWGVGRLLDWHFIHKHPHLGRAERMLGGLPVHAHRLAPLRCLDTLGFERALWVCRRPVAAQRFTIPSLV
jgi:hypothetical protein